MNHRSSLRLALVSVFIAALGLVLAGRLVELTVFRGSALAAAAEDNRTRVVPDPAPRGLILDSSGRPLVANTAAAGVLIDRQTLADEPDGGRRVLRAVAPRLGLTVRELEQRLTLCGTDGAPPRPICDDGSPQTPVAVSAHDRGALLPIAETPADYPGVTLASAVTRDYPAEGVSGGHLLGYLGAVSSEELAADPALTSSDLVGRGGVEQTYDADLRGRAGERRLLVDAKGDVEGSEQVLPAQAGSDLVTSIDATLQARTEEALDNALAYAGSPDARAAAVVMDVRSGRVLALASKPDFRPSDWVGGVTEQAYRRMSDSGALVDYAADGTSPPGSAFKPISVVAMGRSGFDLNGQYDCPGTYTAGGRTFTNHESEAYGSLSLARALEVSCNTVFYRAGDRLWRRDGGEAQGQGALGPIAQAAADLGLGRATGIDLPSESSGMVASPDQKYRLWTERRDDWCAAARDGYPDLRRTDPVTADYYTALDKENCRSGHLWREGDAINAAIGQGYTVTSPLQMAVAYSALANGGTVWQPTIGRAVVAPDGSVTREIAPRQAGSLAGDQRTLRFLARSLPAVARSGTAADAFTGFPLDRYPIAGKTGSAQVEGHNSTSWFASFAPADAPRYAVVVMVTDGGAGGETAAPATRSIYEAIFGVGAKPVFPASGPPQEIAGVRGSGR
ncbi:MAG: penicillin-binding transpeptidase domain-containing protein [Candidatus Nanopelagicales bacterium]